ncbi:MAG: hypothetical protein OQK04_07530 [Kangiellaceae bacterium]|nr:hypothetical protein [Kangiellaceae bacterium]
MKEITDLEGMLIDKFLLSSIVWVGTYTLLFFILIDDRVKEHHFKFLSPLKSVLNGVHKYLLLIFFFFLGFSTWIIINGKSGGVFVLSASSIAFGMPFLSFLLMTKLVDFEKIKKIKERKYIVAICLLAIWFSLLGLYSYLSILGFFDKVDAWIDVAKRLGKLPS